ncbi:transposase [Chryseobacterium antibioticum]|uniref:Transposase n=1 Tax=Chryseobacterium pyrolae TaxID=2987481 RepID=A0ABT2ILD8_9FLAO|nr:transposase [Chryseobacterium pyrolae]MCT2409460.1 transposase [Chryseobacterium pyrolae]
MNFKEIHIGQLIEKRVSEKEIEVTRIGKFLNCTESEITEMYKSKDLSTEILLRWSKLLEYDFFRIYSQHLLLYAPSNNSLNQNGVKGKKPSLLPVFRKNIYTKEVVLFILEMITSGEKTKSQIIVEYRIPKTTLDNWINKYKI